MKIQDAKQMYSAQLNALQSKRLSLSKLLKEQEKSGLAGATFDRVEISKELSQVDAQYESLSKVMEGIMTTESAVHNAEVSKQQGDAMAEAAKEMVKMMEVYRRIASGAKVPQQDERKLMEYDLKLYSLAKQAALMAKQNDEEYDSLWEEEEKAEEREDSGEIAANTEISVPSPSSVAAEASAEIPMDME